MTTTILEAQVPGTESTITIKLVPAFSTYPATYEVTRQAGPGFNYLSCGRSTEAEAQKEFDFLLADATERAAKRQAEDPEATGTTYRTSDVLAEERYLTPQNRTLTHVNGEPIPPARVVRVSPTEIDLTLTTITVGTGARVQFHLPAGSTFTLADDPGTPDLPAVGATVTYRANGVTGRVLDIVRCLNSRTGWAVQWEEPIDGTVQLHSPDKLSW